jgi:hypothetical protein
MKRVALVFALLLHGCADKNLCQGYDGTCIGLTIVGEGAIKQVDDLHIEVRVPDGDAIDVTRADTPMTSPDLASPLVSLPVTTVVYLPPKAIGNSTIVVQGRADGAILSGAESSLVLESGGHYERTLTLAPSSPGGVAACPTFAQFCDDFESDGPASDPIFTQWKPSMPYIIENPSGANLKISVGLDHSESFRGAYALRVLSTTTGLGELIHPLDAAPASGLVAVRAYLYAEGSLVNTTDFLHFDLEGGVTGSFGIFVGAGSSAAGLKDTGYWQLVQGGTITYAGKSALVPYAAWTCFEAVVDLDNKVASLYATDAFAPDIDAPPVAKMNIGVGPVTGFELGLTNAEPIQGVWLDDVAYATQRIGCE